MGVLQSNLHESVVKAVKDGDTEKLKRLLSDGHDFCKNFKPSLLHVAAENGQLEIVKLILEAARNKFSTAEEILKAFPTKKPTKYLLDYFFTPISLAAINGHRDVVEFLLAELHSKSDAKSMGYPLHAAVWGNNIDCAKVILKHKPHILNQPNMGGYPAINVGKLAYDIYTPNIDMLNFLINFGADVNITVTKDSTLLHKVVRSTDLTLVPNLLEKCNDINVRDSLGRTPLFLAAAYGEHAQNVQILLANGADPKIPGKENETPMYPLIVAAKKGFYEVVKILANVTPRYEMDSVTVQILIFWRRYRCLEYLLSRGFTAPSSIVHDLTLTKVLAGSSGQNLSSIIKILVENGSGFGDLKLFHRFGLTKLHTELLILLLDYGVAEIQRSGLRSIAEMCDRIASSYEVCGIYLPDTQSVESLYYEKLLIYFKYFPFAAFSDASKVRDKTVIPVVPELSQICKWCIRCHIVQCHGRVLPEHIKGLSLPNALAKLLFSSDCENTQRFCVHSLPLDETTRNGRK